MRTTDADLARNRRAQDALMHQRHAGFDLAAQDHTPKFCRTSFSVVGEGTRSARTAYHRGYVAIDWRK